MAGYMQSASNNHRSGDDKVLGLSWFDNRNSTLTIINNKPEIAMPCRTVKTVAGGKATQQDSIVVRE